MHSYSKFKCYTGCLHYVTKSYLRINGLRQDCLRILKRVGLHIQKTLSISPVTMSEYFVMVLIYSAKHPPSESISWFEYMQTGNAAVGLTLTI